MKVLAITQARIGSSRLPEKILKEIGGKSLLGIHLERMKKAKKIDRIIVASTFEEGVEKIEAIARNLDVDFFKGSTNDVLDRFYQAAKPYQPDYVVRLTSDCPLIDPRLIDEVIEHTISKGVDYGANVLKEEYPDGQDVEVMKFSALENAWENARLQSEREHVTPYIRKNCDFNGGNLFKASNYDAPGNFSMVRMTVDEQEDFMMMEDIIGELGVDRSWKDYTNYIVRNSEKYKNQKIQRNEGYLKSILKDIE